MAVTSVATRTNRRRPVRETDAIQPSKPPETNELGQEWGVGSVFPNVIWADLNPSKEGHTVLHKPTVTIDQLTEMRRRDGQAKALIQLVTLPLRLALMAGEWIAPDDETEGGQEVEFANNVWNTPPIMGGMTTPKSKVIRQILLALIDGFAAFELVHDVAEKGPFKGKIYPRKIAYRDPRTIKFKVDDNGGYVGFQQTTTTFNGEYLDKFFGRDKTFVFTQHDEFNPYYGVSLFESAYPHFDAKRKLYYIAHLAAQFAAVPGRVGTVAPGAKAKDIAAFRQALMNFAFNGSMVAPPEYEVHPFNPSSGFDFLKLIDHHNHQMSKSILAPFFDQEQRTVLIENNAQNDSDADLFLQCLVSISDNVAENLTHYLMPKYINWNFGTEVYPVFKPGQLSDSARKAIVNLFNTIVVSGVLNCTPEMVREMEKKMAEEMGLDIDYAEIEKKELEAAEAQQKQAEEQMKMQQEAVAAGAAQAVGPDGKPIEPAIGPQKTPVGPPTKLSAEGVIDDPRWDDLVTLAKDLFDERPPEVVESDAIDEGV
jgi:hypothetical protein